MSSGEHRLDVILYGDQVGTAGQDANGKPVFTYAPAWLRRPDAVPLSLSMPMTQARHGARSVAAFLWGLLPENPAVLDRLAKERHVSPANPIALLTIVGEDCAGAVQFLRPAADGTRNRTGAVEWLDETEVASRLRALREQSGSTGRLAGETGQFSLGGAQPKTALYERDGRWGVPSGRIPTTHILKPPMPALEGQAENENVCLMLAQSLGFAAARSSVHIFENETAIVVERYDRVRAAPGDEPIRVHQEDLCQALSILPSRKYQSDGGPSIRAVLHLLRDNATAPRDDMRAFMQAMAMNFVILGTDAHAKNFSLLILPGATGPQIGLAPLYDVNSYLPYLADPHDLRGLRMSMSVGGRYPFDEIMPRHWERESRQGGLVADETLAGIRDLLARMPDAAATVARRCRDSGLSHPVIATLAARIAARCADLRTLYGAEAMA